MAALLAPATKRTLPRSPALRYNSFQLIFGSLVFVAVGDFGLAAVIGVLRPAAALVGAKPRDVSNVAFKGCGTTNESPNQPIPPLGALALMLVKMKRQEVPRRRTKQR